VSSVGQWVRPDLVRNLLTLSEEFDLGQIRDARLEQVPVKLTERAVSTI